jgi:hypothetical protein
LPAQRRTSSGLRDSGQISDISTQGCCVSTGSVPVRVGSHLVIRLKGMEALGGTVRWIARDFAGIEFDNPINGPAVDYLVQTHQTGTQVALSRG